MQLLFRALALQVHVAKDNSIVGDVKAKLEKPVEKLNSDEAPSPCFTPLTIKSSHAGTYC